MRHIVFLIAYIYFLLIDCRRKEIDILALTIYAVVALLTIAMTSNEINTEKLIDTIFSIAFGLAIYFYHIFQERG